MIAVIKLERLRDLWFHTGTACNLECPFCYEGSKPGDSRLERMTLDEIKPFIDEALQLGVERFCFTGGEPLIVKDIVKILSYALQFKPCLLLSNGTAPLIKRVHQLQQLKQLPHTLSFRVSIDTPDESRHDAGRGWGNFKRAIDGAKMLHQAGYPVTIVRQRAPLEDTAGVERQFSELLRKHGLPGLPLVALPELGRLGIAVDESATPPTHDELKHCSTEPMCGHSRMVLKRAGQPRVHTCGFTDDALQFDQGDRLSTAARTVTLNHPRCGQCVRSGATLA